ncbi:MAG: adenine phosphoribosyltransferase [Gemmatimonadota bacterium]|jgi:adenine phosphoribosyltransferase
MSAQQPLIPTLIADLTRAILTVPDFPRPGVSFKDITPVLHDPALFRRTTTALAEPWRSAGITHVLAIESRGFLFGAPVAQHLGAALVPVRKPGKLPRARITESYALEYGADTLECHADALGAGDRVLIVDDVLATGGTAAAVVRLVARTGATLAGIAAVIDLSFLPWRTALAGVRAETLVRY